MTGEGWVPVHPIEGTDWGAFTLDEDETHGMNLVPGYEWKRCLIAVEPSAEFLMLSGYAGSQPSGARK